MKAFALASYLIKTYIGTIKLTMLQLSALSVLVFLKEYCITCLQILEFYIIMPLSDLAFHTV